MYNKMIRKIIIFLFYKFNRHPNALYWTSLKNLSVDNNDKKR